MTTGKIFGERLKKLRKEKGYDTQEIFANKINRSKETIRNWEQGRNIPEIKDLLELCEFLNCDMDYLLGRIECKTHNLTFIAKETGLTEDAIDLLRLYNMFGKSSKIDTISLIIESEAKDDGNLSSLIDTITGYLGFNVDTNNNTLYTATNNGITPFKCRKPMSGEGVVYNPTHAHFALKDIENMYYLKIWDSIKALKAVHLKNKISDTN